MCVRVAECTKSRGDSQSVMASAGHPSYVDRALERVRQRTGRDSVLSGPFLHFNNPSYALLNLALAEPWNRILLPPRIEGAVRDHCIAMAGRKTVRFYEGFVGGAAFAGMTHSGPARGNEPYDEWWGLFRAHCVTTATLITLPMDLRVEREAHVSCDSGESKDAVTYIRWRRARERRKIRALERQPLYANYCEMLAVSRRWLGRLIGEPGETMRPLTDLSRTLEEELLRHENDFAGDGACVNAWAMVLGLEGSLDWGRWDPDSGEYEVSPTLVPWVPRRPSREPL